MTRRIALAILGTVIAALVLAGLGTLLIASVRSEASTTSELRRQAQELAAGLEVTQAGVDTTPDTAAERRQLQNQLRIINAARSVINVDGIDILVYRNSVTEQAPPEGINLTSLNLEALTAGAVQSGSNGGTIYAAAATTPAQPGRFLLVVLTREADLELGDTFQWFLAASAVVIAVGAIVAWLVGRGLTKPVRAASAAAHRISGGDLAVRLPETDTRRPDELGELSHSINTMAEELQRSRDLEQHFLLSVSHDLRTPLTSIRGYADAIADGVGDPAKSAAVIKAEAERLQRLVDDLLDLSKLQSNGFSLRMQRVDLAALVGATVEGFLIDASERNIRLTTDLHGALPVDADRDRMAQVVANLVQNALKFAATTIVVGTTAEGTDAVLWVDDDGPGIAVQDLPHVFERLYVAAHRPARKESSSGLGLAITKELVEAMGGTVTAGVAPNGGARLTVRLPLR